MVLLYDVPGQLGNQLFAYAYLLGNAIEHEYPCGQLSFGPYRQLFAESRRSHCVRYPSLELSADIHEPKPRSLAHKVVSKLWRRDGLTSIGSIAVIDIRRTLDPKVEHYQYESTEFQRVRSEHKLTYLMGYFFRDKPHLFKHRDTIVHHLRPSDSALRDVELFMAAKRTQGATVIGVHIRRGDYKHYRNGQFYYDDETYVRWMTEVADSIPGPKQFLVSTNEDLEECAYRGLPITRTPGDIVGDLFTLSECDLVFGPPSSFSSWASFQRGIPLLHMYNSGASASLESFAPLNLENAP